MQLYTLLGIYKEGEKVYLSVQVLTGAIFLHLDFSGGMYS